jgi:heptaprenyl diphosphate synthase
VRSADGSLAPAGAPPAELAELAELAAFAEQVKGRLLALVDGVPEPLRSPVRRVAGRPAKFLRSMLLAACSRFGPARPAHLVRLAALVELLHLASLLHDDIVDRARVRRGGPAAHTIMGQEHAMLAGLACFAAVGMEAAEIGGGLEQIVGQTAAALAYGELLDVERAFDTTLSLPDYLELVENKTGVLFRLSCLLGAADAGAGPDVAGALAQFGADFGVAFQILDDCLDLASGGQGKPAGIDHMMGLFGAPTLCALAADGSGELTALLLSPLFTELDMPAVRTLVIANGGLSAARKLARDRLNRALSAVDGLDGLAGADCPGGRDLLAALTRMAWRDLP